MYNIVKEKIIWAISYQNYIIPHKMIKNILLLVFSDPTNVLVLKRIVLERRLFYTLKHVS